MKDFNLIQKHIDLAFKEFITQLFRLDQERLKYYYWTSEFFEVVGDLSLRHFHLTTQQKERINKSGVEYFETSDVTFEVNKYSHRHDISIKNINLLFTEENKSGQSNRYEYLKEFIFWQLLAKLAKKSDEFSGGIVELQKKNFLITYIDYLIVYTQKPTFDFLSDYVKYALTTKGENLIKKLDELDAKGVGNEKLRNKIDKLYVLKNEESKIHFVFSRAGGEEKEELRELLDVMGREETGKLYRGQANSIWKLDASITREANYLTNEKDMYYDILSLKPDAFVNDHSIYDRLITMQHFGMPTRLLDITRNPLVAIFFACNNLQCAKNDGVVFTFSPAKEKFLNFEDKKLDGLKILFDKSNININEDEAEKLISDVWFIKGVAKNQRINNQSGDFIFVGEGEEIKQKLHNLPSLTIVIDAPTKTVLLEQLETLNIHGGAVYPDLTHMSNYIRNKYSGVRKVKLNSFFDDIKFNDSESDETNIEAGKTFVKRTRKYKPGEPGVQLTTTFNPDTFWSENRSIKVSEFAKQHDLNEKSVIGLVEDFVAFDKVPMRNDIFDAMNKKPSLIDKNRSIIADGLANLIVSLANELKK